MNKLIVGVPVKNDLDCLKEMLKSLYESTNIDYNLVFVIGEGCNEDTINYLTNLPFKKGVSVEIPKLKTKTPLDAYNKLFELAIEREMDLFVTQTDVIFPKLYKRDWLEWMKGIAQEENVGAVTSLNGGKYSGPDYIDGLYWLGGWCTYYSLKALKKIGGYDKDFPDPQYGVDIEHTYRLSKAGFQIVRIDYWVDHHMMNEREHDKDPNTEFNKQECARYFRRKYKLGEFK